MVRVWPIDTYFLNFVNFGPGVLQYHAATCISPSLIHLYLKNFKTRSKFGKVMDKKVDCFKRPVRCGTVQLKDKSCQRSDIWRSENVVTE